MKGWLDMWGGVWRACAGGCMKGYVFAGGMCRGAAVDNSNVVLSVAITLNSYAICKFQEFQFL